MIKSLSSLRFFFAILVFLVHIKVFSVAIGHTFFIVLSGFILSMVYQTRILNQQILPKTFFLKRLVRIYPLHLLTLLLSLPLTIFFFNESHLKWFSALLLNAFFLQTFVPDINYYFSFNGVSWNAADLMLFYACFPFLIKWLSDFSNKAFTIVMICILLFLVILMNFVSEAYHHFLFYISPLRILDFIFGIYLYRIIKYREFHVSYKLGSLLEVVALVFLAIWFAILNVYPDLFRPYLYSLLLWLPVGLVIVTFYFEKGFISKKILSSPFMSRLGGISFSFYMLHHLVLRYFELINKRNFQVQQGLLYYIFCFIIAVIAAYICNRYFERLFYKFKS